MPLAAAAYNAGPGRPRNWRNGPVIEAAIWAENVPFTETRDYVKKVLANTTNYAAHPQRPAAVAEGAAGRRRPAAVRRTAPEQGFAIVGWLGRDAEQACQANWPAQASVSTALNSAGTLRRDLMLAEMPRLAVGAERAAASQAGAFLTTSGG